MYKSSLKDFAKDKSAARPPGSAGSFYKNINIKALQIGIYIYI